MFTLFQNKSKKSEIEPVNLAKRGAIPMAQAVAIKPVPKKIYDLDGQISVPGVKTIDGYTAVSPSYITGDSEVESGRFQPIYDDNLQVTNNNMKLDLNNLIPLANPMFPPDKRFDWRPIYLLVGTTAVIGGGYTLYCKYQRNRL